MFELLKHFKKKEIIKNEEDLKILQDRKYYLTLGKHDDIVFTDEEIENIRKLYLEKYKGCETTDENCYWISNWIIKCRFTAENYHSYMAKALSESFGAEMLFSEAKLNNEERLSAFYKILEDSHECFNMYRNRTLSISQRKMLFNKIMTYNWDCYNLLRADKSNNMLNQYERNQLLTSISNSDNNNSALRDSFEHNIFKNEEERMKLVIAISKKEYYTWYIGTQYYWPKKQDWILLWPKLKHHIEWMNEYDSNHILQCDPPQYIRELINGYQVINKLINC